MLPHCSKNCWTQVLKEEKNLKSRVIKAYFVLTCHTVANIHADVKTELILITLDDTCILPGSSVRTDFYCFKIILSTCYK